MLCEKTTASPLNTMGSEHVDFSFKQLRELKAQNDTPFEKLFDSVSEQPFLIPAPQKQFHATAG